MASSERGKPDLVEGQKQGPLGIAVEAPLSCVSMRESFIAFQIEPDCVGTSWPDF
jgi:hypothetical protein